MPADLDFKRFTGCAGVAKDTVVSPVRSDDFGFSSLAPPPPPPKPLSPPPKVQREFLLKLQHAEGGNLAKKKEQRKGCKWPKVVDEQRSMHINPAYMAVAEAPRAAPPLPPPPPPRTVLEDATNIEEGKCVPRARVQRQQGKQEGSAAAARPMVPWQGVGLPVYDGAWDADAIEEWVTKMEEFFDMCGDALTEEEKLCCATFHLSGRAHKWWRYVVCMKKQARRVKQQRKQSEVESWKDLKRELIKFFSPGSKSSDQLVFRQFDKLKQRGMSLKEYNERYMSLYMDAYNFSDWEIVENYVEGLEKGVRHQVRHATQCRPESKESLQEVMRLAEFYRDDPNTWPCSLAVENPS